VDFANLTSDDDGGVFVELPVLRGQESFEVTAKNQTTGQSSQTKTEVEKHNSRCDRLPLKPRL
jgi:hypothetical protein